MDCSGPQEACHDDPAMAAALEKYMTLNMVTRAWELRPGRDWYVFIEDETYVVWPNLIHWLRKKAHQARDPFVGSAVMFKMQAFAHGSSGFALSGHLIEQWVKMVPNATETYNKLVRQIPYGGLVFAKSLEPVATGVKQAHPMFNGENPITVPFGPTNWCQPVLTMATMTGEKISNMWEFEHSRVDKVCYTPAMLVTLSLKLKHYHRALSNTDTCITNSWSRALPITAETGTTSPTACATSAQTTKTGSRTQSSVSKSQRPRRPL
jgi:hypothetical protein